MKRMLFVVKKRQSEFDRCIWCFRCAVV